MLMNLKNLDWDDELLSLFRIPKTVLPKILASSDFYGNCNNNYINLKEETSDTDRMLSIQGIPLTG